MGAALDIRIFDVAGTVSRDNKPHMHLRLPDAPIRAADLIRARVRAEVEAFNAAPELERFRGLVAPTDAEALLNGYYRLPRGRQIDAERQIEAALKAFRRNAYFLIVDDEQVEDLDQWLCLRENSTVQFFKLVPLVGG